MSAAHGYRARSRFWISKRPTWSGSQVLSWLETLKLTFEWAQRFWVYMVLFSGE
jgi:hypothetical protein